MKKDSVRTVLILFTIGTLVSAQQVSSESVFSRDDSVELEQLVIKSPVFSSETGSAGSLAMRGDTLQTIEIEIEDQKETNIYKEIAMVAVVAAFVGYIVVTLFFSSDDEEDSTPGGGKDIPTSRAVLFSK